jgi:putative NIF3 family GTP cyclohydrolase 1 type 2
MKPTRYVVRKDRVASVLAHLQQCHPYETMAYDLVPIRRPPSDQGIGRFGRLDSPQTLAAFAGVVKDRLGLADVKVAGNPELVIGKAAVCTGSGSSLMNRFLASDAQVYVSGDLKYHDARNTEWSRRALIDIGHFASEHLIVDVLAQRLAEQAAAAGLNVIVEACKLEREPFVRL